ncbi:MAG: hypothetical protein MUE85_21905 [Microscillaceae bacterium]|jgi:hypothetical protein|nr:hypothetical protein [Microscillaceae bacterium]
MENTDNFDQTLEAYIAQILKIQQGKSQEPLDIEELNQIARNLGLSPEDLNLIDEKFRGFLQRGLGYGRYQNWHKAIEELQQAVNIKPMHIEALFGLADAFRERWLQTGKPADKAKALEYAEKCLQYHYNHEGALHLISQLQIARPRRRSQQAYIRLVGYLMVGGLAVLLGYLAWQFWQDSKIVDSAKKLKPLETHSTLVLKENVEIPLSIVGNTQTKDLQLDIENSFIRKADNGYLYSLRASLISPKREINALEAQLELLDAQDQVVLTEKLDLLDEYAFELRPQDALPISKIIQENTISEQIKKARLLIKKVIQTAVTEPYEPSQTPDITWEVKKPAAVSLSLKERYQTIKPEADAFTHTLVLELKNTGKTPLRTLQISIQWFDTNQHLVHEETAELLNRMQPTFKVGQTRTATLSYLIDLKRTDYQGYKILIQGIQ